jgi:hypothetical protein
MRTSIKFTGGVFSAKGLFALLVAPLLLTGCPDDFNPCKNGGDIKEDRDGDGIPSCVESGGVDLNGDGSMDFTTNSDPNHKDVFVKVDWRTSYPANWNALNDVVAAFAAAPVTNPDGIGGVTLHVEQGQVLADQAVCDCGCIADLVDKNRQILSVSERAAGNANEIFTAKVKFVHYFIWGDMHTAKSSSSGIACYNGYTGINLGSKWPGVTQQVQAATFMHELGHQIGLPHGGVEPTNYKPNYLSVMNYSYQTSWPTTIGVLDYSRGLQPNLDEMNLNEANGIGANSAGRIRFWSPLNEFTEVGAAGGVDWNRSGGAATDILVTGLDINGDRWCIQAGKDDVLDSRVNADDIYWGDGSAFVERTTASATLVPGGDDLAVSIATGFRIHTGANHVLETPLLAGDVLNKLQIQDAPDRVCDSTLVNDDVDELAGSIPKRAKGSTQQRVLSDNDDWNRINYGQLFNLKGAFGLDIPTSSRENPPPSMTREEHEVLQLADLSATAKTTFNARSRVAKYDVTVVNGGPNDVIGGSAVVQLPATAHGVTCTSADSGLVCSPGTYAGGIAVRAELPTIGVGQTVTFAVSVTVDASRCEAPSAYTAEVAVQAYGRVDPNLLNNTATVPFADADGNGSIDVCSWPLTSMTLYGTRSISIGDRAKVLDTDVVYPYGVVAHGDGGGAHRLGVNAHSGDTLSGGNPFLANDASVHGDLTCTGAVTQQQGALITGNKREGQPLPSQLAPLAVDVTWAPYVENEIYLQPDTSRVLASGSYGKVVVNARSHLYLTAGDYQFNELQFESGAQIHLDTSAGPIRMFVRTSLIERGTWNASDPTGANILLAYLGQNAVTFDANVAATVIAPNASVALGSGANLSFSGGFYARELEVRPDVKVVHVPFAGVLPLVRS